MRRAHRQREKKGAGMLQKLKKKGVPKSLWKAMPEDFWKWVERYTLRRAWRMRSEFELNRAEIDDPHQELMIDVARRWRWYKAKKGPDTVVPNWLVGAASLQERFSKYSRQMRESRKKHDSPAVIWTVVRRTVVK